MLAFLKKILSKLFPQKLATEITAELPTPTPVPVCEVPIPGGEPELQLLSEPPPEPLQVIEEPVEEVKPKRARNKGKFVADNKATVGVNEAWVGGKAPTKKSTRKKKK